MLFIVPKPMRRIRRNHYVRLLHKRWSRSHTSSFWDYRQAAIHARTTLPTKSDPQNLPSRTTIKQEIRRWLEKHHDYRCEPYTASRQVQVRDR